MVVDDTPQNVNIYVNLVKDDEEKIKIDSTSIALPNIIVTEKKESEVPEEKEAMILKEKSKEESTSENSMPIPKCPSPFP